MRMADKRSRTKSGYKEENAKKIIEACTSHVHSVFQLFSSVPKGLTHHEREARQKQYGANILSTSGRKNAVLDFLVRFKDPLVIVLLIISIVCFFMGDYRSVIVVAGMLCISVILAYIQESRSTRAAEKLQEMVQSTAIVLEDCKEIEVPVREIVPGDIVILAAGSIIPADLRIFSAKDFFISQSAITGESMPIEKFAHLQDTENKEPLSFSNACFQGSNVISGTAQGIIVSTGRNTYLGAISEDLTKAKESTSFDKGVKSFVWLMVRFMVIMVSLTFLIVGLTKHDWIQALLFGLSVAVGLTPEMLPMIMTVCLSKGAITMSKKKVIVKKLKAIQNFGAMDILCTDKTGTLTQDNIVLERYVDVTNRKSEDVLKYAYMNSYYQTGLRNLLDKAILNHEELDVEKTARKVDEIPFDFNRKRMSVVIDFEDTHVLICKGSVEAVYQVCDRYQIDDDIYPLIEIIKNDLNEEYEALSADGYRVLAIGYKEFPNDKETFSAADEKDMILLGYVAFFDPPKDSSAGAIKALRASGVEVKILTGDNDLVTKKVCHDVGLNISGLLTGKKLSDMDENTFKEAVEKANVFTNLTPAQKEKIIKTLRANGHVIGFMGDGINDAPAMKAADVGISVDSAVDIAKESADIILLEKSLMVLDDGIIEGRKIFANIIKYIKMGASSNFGNMFSVVGGSYFLPFLPMAPIQVLSNNLLYDISQTGIPTDHVDDEQVRKPHRWDMKYIRRFMTWIGPVSSLFDYATFFLMLYFFNCILFSLPETAGAMKAYYEQLFHTGWFVESLLTQTLIVHIIRTDRIPFFQSRASGPMLITTLLVMGIAVFLPYSGELAKLIGLVPLPAIYWLWIAGFLVLYAVITHKIKRFFNKRFGGAS
jgi:Mg2+-importing ATPase